MLACLFVLSACAKQGFPSGGPKDETPPVVLGTTPQNGTLNFNFKEFSILFDEYVNVKDADNNILVSPTMSKKPEYSTKGRSVVVKLKDTLHANTTYLFQFKEGIVDFNEGNALPSYEYVFSTGSSIDSMTLRGKVLDALTDKPRTETITVLAYPESSLTPPDSALTTPQGDSIVAKEQPMYMTRCDKEGNFTLNHLRPGRYLLLAIEDGDKNLRLTGDEPVAFLDTLAVAVKMPPAPDTTTLDSTSASDSLAKVADTLAPTPGTATLAHDSTATTSDVYSYIMKISQDKKEKQRISKSEFLRKSRIQIVTKVPLSPNYSLSQITYDSTSPQLQLYHKTLTKGDTLDVWIGNKECDSITLLLKDTTGLNDTLRLQFRASAPKKAIGPVGISSQSQKTTPHIMQSLIAKNHPFFDTLWLSFDNPVEGICDPWLQDSSSLDSAVLVMAMKDSSLSHCGIHLLPDSTFAPALGKKAYIVFEGKPGEKYRFSIPDKIFYDIFLNKSDSLTVSTEFTKTESYGNIFLTLLSSDTTANQSTQNINDSTSSHPSSLFPHLIVQLTNERGEMVRQQIVSQPCKLSFLHLKGGKYGVRAIIDLDRNNQWTPGNYWQQRQPEKIIHFEKTLELRENWDMEEKWEIGTLLK